MADKKFSNWSETSGPGIFLAKSRKSVILLIQGEKEKQHYSGIPEAIAIAVTIALHRWKHQTLVSIAGGTVCYVLLVQLVFA